MRGIACPVVLPLFPGTRAGVGCPAARRPARALPAACCQDAAGHFPPSCFLSLATEHPWPLSARAPGDEGVQKAGSRSWILYCQLWEPELKNKPSVDGWAGG